MKIEFPKSALPLPWFDHRDSVAARVGPDTIEIVARCYAQTHDPQLNQIPSSEIYLQQRHHQSLILNAPEMFAELNRVLAGDISPLRIIALLDRVAKPHESRFWDNAL